MTGRGVLSAAGSISPEHEPRTAVGVLAPNVRAAGAAPRLPRAMNLIGVSHLLFLSDVNFELGLAH
jgi:hypothetical protein